jgi:lysophospholipase L1-like esterase
MRKHILIILLNCLLFTITSKAQHAPAVMKANRLLFYQDSSAWIQVFQKMKTANSPNAKPIKIAHFGGSHVQAGIWTGEFISQLQRQLKTKGGGYFAFPYTIAKTNGQAYVDFKSNGNWKKCRALSQDFCLPLGINGISAITNDSSISITIKFTEHSVCKQFNMLKVFHNFNPSFECRIAKQNNLETAGKSYLDKGFTYFGFEKFVDSLQLEIVRKDTLQKDFILYGFSIENTEPGIYGAGLGVNGASSSSFLKCNLFDMQLQAMNPDIAIISLGVNDVQPKEFSKAEFMANYDTLILKLKQANPNIAILLTTTTDNYVKRKSPNKRTLIAQQAFFELGLKHKIAVWDLFEVMGGYKSINKWIKAGYAKRDRVHFTNAGYKQLGQLLFEAIWQSYLTNTKINHK